MINWRLSGDRLFSQVEETTETEVPGAPEDSSAAALAAAPAAAPAALAVLVVVAVTILQCKSDIMNFEYRMYHLVVMR